jgi:hypothetical protein
MAISTLTPVLLRANLSDSVLKEYEIVAARTGKPVEQVMSETLTRFASFEAVKPIILSDEERRTVESAVGRNISTSAELVRAVTRALAVTVEGTEVPISQYLMDRLRSRCIGADFEPFLRKTIKELLEGFAGLR